MKENNVFEKLNFTSNNGHNHSEGLLEKIETAKTYKCEELNVSLLKLSVDNTITKFTQQFFNVLNKKENMKTNIGLNFCMKILKHPENENQLLKLHFYDYNYVLSNKFNFLRNEAIDSSDILISVININDKKGIENFIRKFEEIKVNRQAGIFISILIKSTSNFLAKITEKQTVEKLKKDLTNLGIINFIEIEDEESAVDSVETIINEILHFSSNSKIKNCK